MTNCESRPGTLNPAPLVLCTLLLTLAFSSTIGCGGYGQISQRAYEIATATYGACLAKDDIRLTRIEQILNDEEVVNELSATESKWIAQIVATARDGNWESAADSAKRMMMDQVQY